MKPYNIEEIAEIISEMVGPEKESEGMGNFAILVAKVDGKSVAFMQGSERDVTIGLAYTFRVDDQFNQVFNNAVLIDAMAGLIKGDNDNQNEEKS